MIIEYWTVKILTKIIAWPHSVLFSFHLNFISLFSLSLFFNKIWLSSPSSPFPFLPHSTHQITLSHIENDFFLLSFACNCDFYFNLVCVFVSLRPIIPTWQLNKVGRKVWGTIKNGFSVTIHTPHIAYQPLFTKPRKPLQNIVAAALFPSSLTSSSSSSSLRLNRDLCFKGRVIFSNFLKNLTWVVNP